MLQCFHQGNRCDMADRCKSVLLWQQYFPVSISSCTLVYCYSDCQLSTTFVLYKYFGFIISCFISPNRTNFHEILLLCNSIFGVLSNADCFCVHVGSRFYHLNQVQICTISAQMELGDKAVGFILTLTSLSIFTYYTFWVIILVSNIQAFFISNITSMILFLDDKLFLFFSIQPFVDSDHFAHKYFLPQEYAILIPVLAGVILLSFLSVFMGLVMLKSKKKKKTT